MIATTSPVNTVSRRCSIAAPSMVTLNFGPLRADSSSQEPDSAYFEDASLIDISSLSLRPSSATLDDFEHLSHPSPPISSASSTRLEKKARLLYCKRHVAIHTTASDRDNVSGYLGVVEVDSAGIAIGTDEEGEVKKAGAKELLVTWVPNALLERMDEADREGYRRVEGRFSGESYQEEQEEDGELAQEARISRSVGQGVLIMTPGFVFVSIPPPKVEKYAFSIPLTGIYSILVYLVSFFPLNLPCSTRPKR